MQKAHPLVIIFSGIVLAGLTAANVVLFSLNSTSSDAGEDTLQDTFIAAQKDRWERQKRTAISQDIGGSIAFFYQFVGKPAEDGSAQNAIRMGTSTDGFTVKSVDADALVFNLGRSFTESYGDPVFSRLASGSWAMTGWTGADDTRGPGSLLYHESVCPAVRDADVKVIKASSADGCRQTSGITLGKTSQVFDVAGSNYLIHSIEGDVHLSKLSDASHTTKDMESLCVLPTAVNTLADLQLGESTPIINDEDTDSLFMSDTAIAQRKDDTWVLFIKAISSSNTCTAQGLCELCGRSIYRTTSTDLLTWSPLEKVVSQASVPEATTMPDGSVWLYWQDFSQACAAESEPIAAIAPISAAYEMPDTHTLSEPVMLRFTDEAFETDAEIHYATNANPILLPNDEARTAYEACFE